MTVAERLYEDALQLPASARELLIDRLIASVSATSEEDAAFLDELARRDRELDEGAVQEHEWDDVRAEALQRVNRRASA